jgi:hypothetical protein
VRRYHRETQPRPIDSHITIKTKARTPPFVYQPIVTFLFFSFSVALLVFFPIPAQHIAMTTCAF